MKRYVVNTLRGTGGDHEVHESNCLMLPSYRDQKDLGYHFSAGKAIAKARETYSTANGCEQCMRVSPISIEAD